MAKRTFLTSEAIFKATMDCFLKRGFEETTIQMIATKLGVSQPALYKHFKNKMDLLGFCCEFAVDKGRMFIDKSIDGKAPARERFAQYVRANFTFFSQNRREALAITSSYFFGQTDKRMRAILNQIHRSSIDRFEAILTQVSYEESAPIADSRALADLVHDAMIGEVFKTIYQKQSGEREAHQTKLIESLLGTVYKNQ